MADCPTPSVIDASQKTEGACPSGNRNCAVRPHWPPESRSFNPPELAAAKPVGPVRHRASAVVTHHSMHFSLVAPHAPEKGLASSTLYSTPRTSQYRQVGTYLHILSVHM